MDTVVDEKPLSLATSRIVTATIFISSLSYLCRVATNDGGLNSRCRWRTLQQRAQPVSSSTMRLLLIFVLLACGLASCAQPMLQAQAQPSHTTPPPPKADPRRLFQQGEAALRNGNLHESERAFRGVLRINPQVAGAYANLGVIYMR